MQLVGNVLGSTNFNFVFERFDSGYGEPYALIESGFPNIGNNSFTGTSPPISWNFPGRFWGSLGGGENGSTNGTMVANGTYGPTNTLWTNMFTSDFRLTFTNYPAVNVFNYPLKFQTPGNTNAYFPDEWDGLVLSSTAGGTPSNIVLNRSITISNGWTLFVAGAGGYQQRQATNKWTWTIHGNGGYTNGVGVDTITVQWDSGIADQNVPDSILYPGGAPSYWGTNRWPWVDAEAAVPETDFPAWQRFRGVSSGSINVAAGVSVGPGVSISSGVSIK